MASTLIDMPALSTHIDRWGVSYAPAVSAPTADRTLVLVKPDGVARGLVGQVIARLEAKGLRLVAAELRTLTARSPRSTTASTGAAVLRLAGRVHHQRAADGPGRRGPRAIEAFRALAGATDPVKATPGTIRGDFALEVQSNIVHGSDSPESAAREIELFFPDLG